MTEENNEILAKIAALIKEARLSKGLTLIDLELRTGISDGVLSKIENGKKNFNVTTLVRLAEGLEMPLEKLLAKFS